MKTISVSCQSRACSDLDISQLLSAGEVVLSFEKQGDQCIFLIVESPELSDKAEGAGLGDMVSSALSAVGVTKERVSAAIGRPCRCGERQAALNSLGAKYLGIPEGSTAQNTDSPTSDSP